MRPSVVALAVADVVLLVAASVGVVSRSTDLASRVRARPVPARVTPTGDAGLGIRRGGRTKNLGDGGDIEPTLRPRGRSDCGLTTRPGSSVVLILRGNFPEARVQLALR